MLQNNPLAEELDCTMVRIPGGQSIVGLRKSQKSILSARSGSHPDMLRFHTNYREINVEDFWMDRYPVTRGQFHRFLKETGYKIPVDGWLSGWTQLTGWHEFRQEDETLPMTGVNAEDAAAYAAWCGKRLPAGMEWERAWRGDDGRLFPWGDEWKDGFTFRSPGNIPLKPAMTVGTFGEVGPYGLCSYGLVLEWVKNDSGSQGEAGALKHPWTLAGGSFLHTMEYSFCPANRSSWSPGMRIYNGGFRCVADAPPRNLVRTPAYRPVVVPLPTPVSIRRDLYRKKPIQLIPMENATLLIKVPWFPDSLWVLDCPESDWGDFGGANAWPRRPEQDWRIPWKLGGNGRRACYVREKNGKRQAVEVWAEEDTLHYRYEATNVTPIPDSFCFKTFSPFFTSQERRTVALVTPEGIISGNQLPLSPEINASLGWRFGEILPPAQTALQSFDKTAMILFSPSHCHAGGNGLYPCVHLKHLGVPDEGGGVQSGKGEYQITFCLK